MAGLRTSVQECKLSLGCACERVGPSRSLRQVRSFVTGGRRPETSSLSPPRVEARTACRRSCFRPGRSLLGRLRRWRGWTHRGMGNGLTAPSGRVTFQAGVGFTQGSLLAESVNGAKSWVDAELEELKLRRSSVSGQTGKTLLYAIDPVNSASIAAKSLASQVLAQTNMTDHPLGIALVDPGHGRGPRIARILRSPSATDAPPGRPNSQCRSATCSSAAA